MSPPACSGKCLRRRHHQAPDRQRLSARQGGYRCLRLLPKFVSSRRRGESAPPFLLSFSWRSARNPMEGERVDREPCRTASRAASSRSQVVGTSGDQEAIRGDVPPGGCTLGLGSQSLCDATAPARDITSRLRDVRTSGLRRHARLRFRHLPRAADRELRTSGLRDHGHARDREVPTSWFVGELRLGSSRQPDIRKSVCQELGRPRCPVIRVSGCPEVGSPARRTASIPDSHDTPNSGDPFLLGSGTPDTPQSGLRDVRNSGFW